MLTHAVWGKHLRKKSDIIQGGRMTSFCKWFSSVWFLALDLFGSYFSRFPSVALKYYPPWGRQHQLLPIFKFPVRHKHFSMSDKISGFHSAHSVETGLKRATKNSEVAQSNRFFSISFPQKLCTVVDTADQVFLLPSLFASSCLYHDCLRSEDHSVWTFLTCFSSTTHPWTFYGAIIPTSSLATSSFGKLNSQLPHSPPPLPQWPS